MCKVAFLYRFQVGFAKAVKSGSVITFFLGLLMPLSIAPCLDPFSRKVKTVKVRKSQICQYTHPSDIVPPRGTMEAPTRGRPG